MKAAVTFGDLIVVAALMAVACPFADAFVSITTYQSQLTVAATALIQGTAYDDRTDTLYLGTSESSSPYKCHIIAARQITAAINTGTAWTWVDTGVGGCTGAQTAPTGVAWAKGTSFGRPDTAENDVLFFSAYGAHSIWGYSPATNATALVAGISGTRGRANGAGTAATFSFPEGIAFIDNVGGVARTSVFIADYSNYCIREARIDWPASKPFGQWTVTVTTVAGLCGFSGTAAGAPGRFSEPRNVAFARVNTVMYVGDNGALRLVTGLESGSTPRVSTVRSIGTPGLLSVAVLPAAYTGANQTTDYVLYGDANGYVVRMAENYGAWTTRTVAVDSVKKSSVRYVGWLPTGRVVVCTTTQVFVSNSAVLPAPVSYGDQLAVLPGPSATTLATSPTTTSSVPTGAATTSPASSTIVVEASPDLASRPELWIAVCVTGFACLAIGTAVGYCCCGPRGGVGPDEADNGVEPDEADNGVEFDEADNGVEFDEVDNGADEEAAPPPQPAALGPPAAIVLHADTAPFYPTFRSGDVEMVVVGVPVHHRVF